MKAHQAVLVFAALTASTAAARAASLSYSNFEPGPSTAEFDQFTSATGEIKAGAASFQLPQFDPALGTLTSVQFLTTYAWRDVTALLDFNCPNASYQTGDCYAEAELYLDFRFLDITGLGTVDDASFLGDEKVGTYPNSPSGSIGFTDGSISSSFAIDPSLLSAFIGTGMLGLSEFFYGFVIQPVYSYDFSTPANDFAQAALTGLDYKFRSDATITYLFDPAPPAVPVPGPLPLLGLGLAGLALTRCPQGRRVTGS